MPAFRVNAKVTQKGAVFAASDTKARAARMIIGINEAIAVEGVNLVLQRLSQVLRNPTGFYESRIAIERRQTYRGVWDQNVIYGPWLEGTSARNATTRFKGYATFRKTKQLLDSRKEQIAQPMVNKFIADMNG